MDLVEQCSLAAGAAAGLTLNGCADRRWVQAAGELQTFDFGGDFAEFGQRFHIRQLSFDVRLPRVSTCRKLDSPAL